MYERFIKANAISNEPAPDTWKNSRPRRSILDSRFAECGGISINKGLYRVHLIYFRKNDDSLRLNLSSKGSIPAKFSGKINVTYLLGKTTLFSIVLIVILIGFISACKSPDPKLAQPGFVRLLQDTTGNNRAKMDLLQLEQKSFCPPVFLLAFGFIYPNGVGRLHLFLIANRAYLM
jgi:hypothetical protein